MVKSLLILIFDRLLDEYAPTNYWEKTLTGSGHDPGARKCEYIPISEQGVIEEENEQDRREIDDYLFNVVKDIICAVSATASRI